MAESEEEHRQYSEDYLKFGFIASPTNESIPMCPLCEKTFSNDNMKPTKMKDHLERIHCAKKEAAWLFESTKSEILEPTMFGNIFQVSCKCWSSRRTESLVQHSPQYCKEGKALFASVRKWLYLLLKRLLEMWWRQTLILYWNWYHWVRVQWNVELMRWLTM